MKNRIAHYLPDEAETSDDFVLVDGVYYSLTRPLTVEPVPAEDEAELDRAFDQMLRDALRKSDSLGPVDDEGCER